MPNKYGAVKKMYRDTLYDSAKEADYSAELDLFRHAQNPKDRVVAKEIQKAYPININGKLCFKYLLDFKVTYADGRVEHIDVKGYKKGCAYALFRIKKKCVEAQYGIKILER